MAAADEVPIPVEVRARIAANAFFDALLNRDYAAVALAHDRLRDLGWHLTPIVAEAERKRRR